MVRPAQPPLGRAPRTHTRTDRPVHSVICSFAAAGFLLLSISRAWPGLFRIPQSGTGYVEIPLDDREETTDLRETTPDRDVHAVGPGARLSRLLLLVSICALTVRVELFRQIYKATECTISSVEVRHNPESNGRITLTDLRTKDHSTPCYLDLRCTTLPEASKYGQGRKS